MARLKDIAEKANVSISTVSKVLNHDPAFSISLKNRQKILQIAEDLYYPVNTAPIKKGKLEFEGSIALILLYDELEEVEDSYYLSIKNHCKNECNVLGLEVKEYYYRSLEKPLPIQDHDLFIFIGSGSYWNSYLTEQVKKMKTAPILVDFEFNEGKTLEVDTILIDMKHVVDAVITYLMGLGYSKIGFIGSRDYNPSKNIYSEDERELFFTEKMKTYNAFHKEWMYTATETTLSSGYLMAKRAISSPLPEVFFVETDTMAIGVVKALKEEGYSIPEDIGIISCNDIPEAQYLTPSLTTMKLHTPLMGVMAARLAAEKLLFHRSKGVKIYVPSELVVRDSCRKNEKVK